MSGTTEKATANKPPLHEVIIARLEFWVPQLVKSKLSADHTPSSDAFETVAFGVIAEHCLTLATGNVPEVHRAAVVARLQECYAKLRDASEENSEMVKTAANAIVPGSIL